MRVLVTGSRQFLEQSIVYRELDAEFREWIESGRNLRDDNQFTVVHGGAPGADTLVAQWCHDRRYAPIVPVQEVHPANWNRYGGRAGPIRNMEMIQLGADLVIGFFQPGAGNVGTRHCITESRRWLEHRGTIIREVWAE